MDRSAVILDQVSKRYGSSHSAAAVTTVSLRVAMGEFLAIMGPSGCGKSTLLNLVAGIDTPTSGRVRLAGRELSALSDDVRSDVRLREIGFVFQTFNLLPTLTAEENVTVPLELMGARGREARTRAAAALASVGIARPAQHRRPAELSGGEQQRVAIARALIGAPQLLLADEPTGNLDSQAGEGVLDLLRTLNGGRGLTIILVTHNPTAAAYAHRIVYMRDGRIEAEPRRAGDEMRAGPVPTRWEVDVPIPPENGNAVPASGLPQEKERNGMKDRTLPGVPVASRRTSIHGWANAEALPRSWATPVHFVMTLLLYARLSVYGGLALAPGIYLVHAIFESTRTMALPWRCAAIGIGVFAAYFAYAICVIGVVGLVRNLTFGGTPLGRFRFYSLNGLRWAMYNTLILLPRYTCLQFMLRTPLANLFHRLMGMKLGARVQLSTANIHDSNLIEIGAESVIGEGAWLTAHSAERGYLHTDRIKIGRRVTVGINAVVLPGVEIGDGALIGAGAVLTKSTKVGPNEIWGGVPATKVGMRRLTSSVPSEPKIVNAGSRECW